MFIPMAMRSKLQGQYVENGPVGPDRLAGNFRIQCKNGGTYCTLVPYFWPDFKLGYSLKFRPYALLYMVGTFNLDSWGGQWSGVRRRKPQGPKPEKWWPLCLNWDDSPWSPNTPNTPNSVRPRAYIYNTMWFLLTYHTYYANMIIYIYIHIIYIYIHVDYTGLTQQIKFCANKSGFESHVLKLSPHALRFVEYIYI